jgi:integrase/recombinase XerD
MRHRSARPEDDSEPIVAVGRFLDHLAERACSPHTLCAYGYDLQQLFTFLASEQLAWQAFEPADALRFLTFLRRRPSQRPAQRLGLMLIDGGKSSGPAAISVDGESDPCRSGELLRVGDRSPDLYAR